MYRENIYKSFLSLWVAVTYCFLYIPIFILVLFSFNSIIFPYKWVSFSTQWYYELFHSDAIWYAMYNSLFVGLSAVFLSTLIGLLFVVWNAQKKSDYLLAFFYPNLVIPEIVLAVGLLSFFIFFSAPLGVGTLIFAHTLLGLGYTVPMLYNGYRNIDDRLIEASLDLGATPFQTFIRVIIPILKPTLIASGLLVFILSLDDFLIAFFCAGTEAQTLSLYIFAMIRTGVSPEVNALATLMLIVSTVFVFLFCSLKIKENIW